MPEDGPNKSCVMHMYLNALSICQKYEFRELNFIAKIQSQVSSYMTPDQIDCSFIYFLLLLSYRYFACFSRRLRAYCSSTASLSLHFFCGLPVILLLIGDLPLSIRISNSTVILLMCLFHSISLFNTHSLMLCTLQVVLLSALFTALASVNVAGPKPG